MSLVSEMSNADTTRLLEDLGYLGLTREELLSLRSKEKSLAVSMYIANLIRYGEQAMRHGPYSITPHFVDLNTTPKNPDGWQEWQVKSHERLGRWCWQPSKVKLTTLPDQDERRASGIGYLTQEVKEMSKRLNALNVNMLWYYWEKPWLIDADWRGLNVYFPGTTFVGPREKSEFHYGNESVLGFEWSRDRNTGRFGWRICSRRVEQVGPKDVIAVTVK